MRKRYRVMLLAAIVAAAVVPVGFALSVDPSSSFSFPSSSFSFDHAKSAAAKARGPGLHEASVPFANQVKPFGNQLMGSANAAALNKPGGLLLDSGELFIVGTVLVALGAAVRRTI